MTKIPSELIANWPILRQTWFPRFVPKCNVNSYSILAWRVAALNAGDFAGKQVVMERLKDKKSVSISFGDLEKNFLSESNYINFAKDNGFSLSKKINFELVLVPKI